MAVYCSKCGKQQSDDAIFCMNCGQPLKSAGQPNPDTVRASKAEYGNQGYPPTGVQPSSAYSNYGQAAQQQWGATPRPIGIPLSPPPQKKSRPGLIISLIVLLLVVVAAGIGGYLYVNRSTPEKTLQAYCNALLHSDAQGVDDQLSTREQANVADISAGLKRLNDPSLGGMKNCTFSNVQQNGSTATADLQFTLGNPTIPTGTNHDTLIDENGSWKIDGGQDPAFT